MVSGRLIGIARKVRPRAAVESVDRVAVSLDAGIAGDFRGRIKPGGRGRRQITILAMEDWRAALDTLGFSVAWQERRANLLVEGIALPRRKGARLRIGEIMVEITGECDPCSRMDAVAPGLMAALAPDWRGGRTARVLAGGVLAIGDDMRVETA
ncbi:MOSC domain-containing protein [Flavisphingomonas formosensis]|uniref:MOSC domain-containing protein n=1 Tax=Flavisphingomonas formosensis TaxID=861534 RepID=UPI0018DF2DC1|nr:MOSC domain-containing protein [Sphingomonas formosensis]